MAATDTLEHLVETFENGQRGFAEGAERLREDGRSDLATEFELLGRQRAMLASELRSVAGIPTDGEGTAPGAMHRTWLKMKDALTGHDPHAILDAAEQGEDHAMSTIKDVLDKDVPEPARSCVVKAQTEVRAAHDTVKRLRDAEARN